MNQALYSAYVKILEEELVPAMGCTEPIAVAYAAALARKALGEMPQSVEVHVSANIIKNVKRVSLPATLIGNWKYCQLSPRSKWRPWQPI